MPPPPMSQAPPIVRNSNAPAMPLAKPPPPAIRTTLSAPVAPMPPPMMAAPVAAPAPAPAPAAAADPKADPKFDKYARMQKAGLPHGAIVNAMARDGISDADQKTFLG